MSPKTHRRNSVCTVLIPKTISKVKSDEKWLSLNFSNLQLRINITSVVWEKNSFASFFISQTVEGRRCYKFLPLNLTFFAFHCKNSFLLTQKVYLKKNHQKKSSYLEILFQGSKKFSLSYWSDSTVHMNPDEAGPSRTFIKSLMEENQSPLQRN